ncbi:hypothetical protein BZL39_C00160 [Zygosaccharomyces parabailii]|nr:hypothetical protein BZL39_C00160 [Zygosaccharomyces parabailii]
MMEVIPKITQEVLARSNEKYAYRPWERVTFEDSETIIGCKGKTIRASFDNGKKWQKMLEVTEDIDMLFLDKFHGRNRAFAEDLAGGLYVTENMGRDWMKIQKPPEVENSPFNTIETHPFVRNYMLLKCEIEYGGFERGHRTDSQMELISYISKDFGKSFERIAAPVDSDVTPDIFRYGTECWFAASSYHSTLPKELIYGIHSMTAVDKQGCKTMDKQVLFFSSDLGKTTKLVEELMDRHEFSLEIFSCAVLFTAHENIDGHQTEKIWFSTGGPFKRATLPLEGDYPSLGQAFEDYLGRILLPFYTVEDGRQGKFAQLLIWDSFKFKLSQLDPILLRPDSVPKYGSKKFIKRFPAKFYIEKFGNCRGLLLGKLFGVIPQERAQTCVSMAIHDYVASSKKIFNNYMNLISFDNGNNWSKLKLSDQSNIRRYLSKYHIEDLENCSLQIFYYTYSERNDSMAKVFMAKGAISHSNHGLNDNHCMSFISRDAGINWELAFTFPVYSVFADVGNIIVAIPQQQEGFDDFNITKVFFSSNQGKTWIEHELEQSVLCSNIQIDTSGSSIAVMFLQTEHAHDRTEKGISVVLKLDFSHSLSESE